MFEWFTKSKEMEAMREEIVRLQEAEQKRLEEEERRKAEEEAKKKAEEEAKTKAEEEERKKNEEPWVNVKSLKLDPNNQSNGIFELDWNDKFIEMLGENGYAGRTPEEIVDLWFNDVCRSVAAETEQDFDPNMTMIPIGNIKY